MKTLIVILAATGGILSGCVGYAEPYASEPVYDNRPVYRAEGHRPARGDGDRDRDGIPNRVDRDKDGDGVPNRMDNRPNNPNRY